MPSLVPFHVVDHDPARRGAVGLELIDIPADPAPFVERPRASYVLEGPHGPVFEGYVDAGTATRVWGPSVPASTLELGSPGRVDALELSRQLDAGLRGRVGDQVVRIRAGVGPSPLVREVVVELGPVAPAYVLRATGLLARVALYDRDDALVATFSVRGRKPHRIRADASPAEVVLAMLLVRMVPGLAHRR
jgi:hypothetical protein